MPLVVEGNREVYRPDIATSGLAGRVFRRRTPANDPGDVVICLGAVDVGGHAGPIPEIVIASATFGAIPDGWDAATVSYGIEQFAADYTEANDSERAVLALEQAAAASEADKASAKRESPWSRS
jgi:hypothetical protein